MKNYLKIIKLMFSSSKKILSLAAIVLLALISLEIAIPIGINSVLSNLEGGKTLGFLICAIVIFGVAYILLCGLSALNTKLYIKIGKELLWKMREQIYQVLWKANYYENVQKNKDKFKFVLANQTYTAFAIAVIYTLGGMTNLLTIIAFLAVAFYYSLPVGFALIASILVTLFISFTTGKSILNGYEACNNAQEEDTSQIYETVDLVEAARTNGLSHYYLDKNRNIHNKFMSLSEKAESRSAFCESVENSAHSLIYIIIAGIIILTGQRTGGEIVTILFITNMTLEISQRVQRQIQVIIKNIPVFNDVVELMEIPMNGGTQLDKIQSIDIRNLSFDIDDRKIFNDINMELSVGDNLIIKGENGSGKSSLLKMIMGLYRPSSGQILFNHQNIEDFDTNTFYKEICYISQEELLLNETVENYLREVTHTNVSDEVIARFREKVKLNEEITSIEENGATLSGGEKKKMFMLKCLLKNSTSLVILDEIDAGVDAETKKVWKDIENELVNDKEKIVIKISHIDSDMTGYNKVIQL